MPRYRFRLPDGQTYESERTPAQIRKAHPTATITHRVEFDGVGNPSLVPFTGKQEPEEPSEGESEGEKVEDASGSDEKAPSGDAVAETGDKTLKGRKSA